MRRGSQQGGDVVGHLGRELLGRGAERVGDVLRRRRRAARPLAVDVLDEELAELGGRQAPVHLLHHAAVLVPHHRRDEVRRHAGGAEPLRTGAAQVVRRARGDLGALAGGVEIAADVRPRGEELSAGAARVLHRVAQEVALLVADDRDRAAARRALGAVEEHVGEVLAHVLAPCPLALAPVGRRRDEEGDARGLVGDELREEELQLFAAERALLRLVGRGERDRHDLGRVAFPDAATAGELQRRAHHHQLLVDRVVAGALGPARGDEGVDVSRPEAGEQERAVVALRVALEQPHPVPRLHLVAVHGGLRAPARADELAAVVEQQLEGLADRGALLRGSIGIGGLSLQALVDEGGGALVGAARRALVALVGVVDDVRVPDAPAAKEPSVHREILMRSARWWSPSKFRASAGLILDASAA